MYIIVVLQISGLGRRSGENLFRPLEIYITHGRDTFDFKSTNKKSPKTPKMIELNIAEKSFV